MGKATSPVLQPGSPVKLPKKSTKINPFVPALAISDNKCDVSFNIRLELLIHKNEFTNSGKRVDIGIYVTGEGEALGNWDPKKAPRLVTTNSVYPLWSLTLRLPKSKLLKYHYLIISKMQKEDGQVVELIERDGNVSPTESSRSVDISGVKTTIDDGWFGQLNSRQFCRSDEGWLGFHSEEIRFIVGAEGKAPVSIGKLYEGSLSPQLKAKREQREMGSDSTVENSPEFRLRMTMLPFSTGKYPHPHNTRTEKERRGYLMDLKVLQPVPLGCDWKKLAEENMSFCLDDPDPFSEENNEKEPFWQPPARLDYYQLIQPTDGFVCTKDNISIFSARLNSNEDGNCSDYSVYIEVLDAQSLEHIGSTVLTPAQFMNRSSGSIFAPIFRTVTQHPDIHHPDIVPIGEFCCDFLIIKPCCHPANTLSNANRTGWYGNGIENPGRTLDIGHRGTGSSHSHGPHKANLVENTIRSLLHAANSGADFVEFDVQLSKDRIPIIYHDFTVFLNLRKVDTKNSELFEIHLKDLTLSQMRRLKMDHVPKSRKMFPCFDKQHINEFIEQLESDPICIDEAMKLLDGVPTLKDLFEHLPTSVGFNVEVKYPILEMDNQPVINQWEDKNEYVDIILKTILEYSQNRKIVISSFDPDICTMFQLKQPLYPVIFLTSGGFENETLHDLRTKSIEMAVLFAQSERLLGIVSDSLPLLQASEYNKENLKKIVQDIKDKQLVVFTYGAENNKEENVELQRWAGIDAVIMDKIDSYKERQRVKEGLVKV